jgi:putative FmdB family regulatory protein
MPIYGYRCSSCGHEIEVLQKLSDPPLKQCPNCGGELHKKLYPAGVIFKGSGFYSTDYKAGKSSASESASSNGSTSSGEKASEKAGESKPAAESKAESKPSKSDSSD